MRFSGAFGLVDSDLSRQAEAAAYTAYSNAIAAGKTYAEAQQASDAARAAFIKAAIEGTMAQPVVPDFVPGKRGVTNPTVTALPVRSDMRSTRTGVKADSVAVSPAQKIQMAISLTESVLAKKRADLRNAKQGSSAANLLLAEINALEAELVSLRAQLNAGNAGATGGAPVLFDATTTSPATNSNVPNTSTVTPNASVSNAELERQRAAAAAQEEWRAKQAAIAAAEEVRARQAQAEADAQAAADNARTEQERAAAEAELARLREESIAPSGGGGWLIVGLGLAVKWFLF